MKDAYSTLRRQAIRSGITHTIGTVLLYLVLLIAAFTLGGIEASSLYKLKSPEVIQFFVNIILMMTGAFWLVFLRHTPNSFFTANFDWIKFLPIEKSKIIRLFQIETFVYLGGLTIVSLLANTLIEYILPPHSKVATSFSLIDNVVLLSELTLAAGVIWINSKVIITKSLSANVTQKPKTRRFLIFGILLYALGIFGTVAYIKIAALTPLWIFVGVMLLIIFPLLLKITARQLAFNRTQTSALVTQAAVLASFVTIQFTAVDYAVFDSLKKSEKLESLKFYAWLFDHKVSQVELRSWLESGLEKGVNLEDLDSYLAKRDGRSSVASFYMQVDFSKALANATQAGALVDLISKVPDQKLNWTLYKLMSERSNALKVRLDDYKHSMKALLLSKPNERDLNEALAQKGNLNLKRDSLIALRYFPVMKLFPKIRDLEKHSDEAIATNAKITAELYTLKENYIENIRVLASNNPKSVKCAQDDLVELNHCLRATAFAEKNFDRIHKIEAKGWIPNKSFFEAKDSE